MYTCVYVYIYIYICVNSIVYYNSVASRSPAASATSGASRAALRAEIVHLGSFLIGLNSHCIPS